MTELCIARNSGRLGRLDVNDVELAAGVFREGGGAVVDDHEVDRGQGRVRPPVVRVLDRFDVITGSHLRDLERPIGHQGVG